MKKKLVIALSLLLVAATAFAYLLQYDENGEPYGIFKTEIVAGSGPPGGIRLMNSAGLTHLYTFQNGGMPSGYFLGTYNLLTARSLGGTQERLGATLIGGAYGLNTFITNDPSNLAWFGLGGYPSSSINLFENSSDNSVYTRPGGNTWTIEFTGNGSGSLSPAVGKRLRVTNVTITTNSSTGIFNADFSAAIHPVIARLYAAAFKTFTSGVVAHIGNVNAYINVSMSGFGVGEKTFMSITYVEE